MFSFIMGCFILSGCAEHLSDSQGRDNSSSSHTQFNDLNKQGEDAFDQGDYAHALQAFKQQLELQGTNTYKTWFNIGACHWNSGQRKESIEAYQEAIDLRPIYQKAHRRLAHHYVVLGQKKQAKPHWKRQKAIGKVQQAMAPIWEKTNSIRGRGADWHKAGAMIHRRTATLYAKLQYSAMADFEWQLEKESLKKEKQDRQRPAREARAAQEEADTRALNTEIIATIGDMTALVLNVDPASPSPSSGLAGSSANFSAGSTFTPSPRGGTANLIVGGIGGIQQSFDAYANTLQMFEGKLRQQREAAHQQGLMAQQALLDPEQAKIQQDAQSRTDALRKRLEKMEKLAQRLLEEERMMKTQKTGRKLDTLDL